ncbi:MAG: Tetratricopeptide repeat-containing protein [Mucilaginibacter sp.]|nr:Tetratricopeptide repeat-containing protein [Mucilaginibacter sp.]
MPLAQELLKQAQTLNENKEYAKVVELLSNDLLSIHQNADLYAEKALSYGRLNKIDLCNVVSNQALSLNPLNAKANSYQGNVYYNLKDYTKAIEFYNKALEINPTLTISYNGLGNVYRDLKNYNKAIEFYNKAIEINVNYSTAYNGLGITYRILKDYNKAIELYEIALNIDSNNPYIYNNIANVYTDLNKYDTAIKFYDKVIEIDPEFVGIYYNRALAFQKKEDFENAYNDFNKYIELAKENEEYYIKNAKSKIEDLKKIIRNPAYSAINEIVDKIKNNLLYEDKCVTHYTSFFVTKLLLLENNKLRISEGTYLNDTSEGRELFDFLPRFYNVSLRTNDTIAKPFAPKPFIGSFVADIKHDDLTLWRMYGKEKNIEASGCALTVEREKLLENIKASLLPDDNTDTGKNSDEEFRFFRVAYRTHETDRSFVIPGAPDKEKELNNLMKDLSTKTDDYLKNKFADEKELLELLNDIAFLFKSAEYQHENELRLVVKGGGFTKTINKKLPLRVYIDLVEINPILRKITLGPKVEKADEWASTFYYILNERGYNPDIFISCLPFK